MSVFVFEDRYGNQDVLNEEEVHVAARIRKDSPKLPNFPQPPPVRPLYCTPLWPVDFEAVNALRRAEEQLKQKEPNT